MRAPTELMKGNAAALVLSCLAREPMHGYRVAREIERLSEGYFVMGEGTLYAHLHQLEGEGLIEGSWEKVTGGRERKLYRITDHGRAHLARRQREWQRFRTCLDHIFDLAPGPEPATTPAVALAAA